MASPCEGMATLIAKTIGGHGAGVGTKLKTCQKHYKDFTDFGCLQKCNTEPKCVAPLRPPALPHDGAAGAACVALPLRVHI